MAKATIPEDFTRRCSATNAMTPMQFRWVCKVLEVIPVCQDCLLILPYLKRALFDEKLGDVLARKILIICRHAACEGACYYRYLMCILARYAFELSDVAKGIEDPAFFEEDTRIQILPSPILKREACVALLNNILSHIARSMPIVETTRVESPPVRTVMSNEGWDKDQETSEREERNDRKGLEF